MLLGSLVLKILNYERPGFDISQEVYSISMWCIILEKPTVPTSSLINDATCFLLTIVCCCQREFQFLRIPAYSRLFLSTFTKVQSIFPTHHLNWENTIFISALYVPDPPSSLGYNWRSKPNYKRENY
jgi:hypothetical protein